MGPPRAKLQRHHQSPLWAKDITARGCGKCCGRPGKASLLLGRPSSCLGVMEGVGMGTPGLVLFAVKLKALPFLSTAPRD